MSLLESPWLYVAVPKHILIENHRLGLTLRLLQLSVVLGLVRVYFSGKNWMMEQTRPEAFQAYWVDSNVKGYKMQKEKDSHLPFCKDPKSLDYRWNKDYTYRSFGCADLMEGEESIKGDASIYIPTYFQDTWTQQTAGEDCPDLKMCCGKNWKEDTCKHTTWQQFGTYIDSTDKNLKGEPLCKCFAKRSYFVRGVAGLNVSLIASYMVTLPARTQVSGSTKRAEDNILVVVRAPRENATARENASARAQPAVLLEPGDVPEAAAAASGGAAPHGRPAGSGRPAAASAAGRRGGARASSMSLEVDSAGSVARHWERGPEAEALLGSGPEAAPPLQIRHEPREPRPGRRGWGPVSLLDTLHSRVANWSAVDTDTAGQATYFKPGDMVGMSLEEWLQHATVMGAGPMRDAGNTTGSLLDLPNTNVRMNTDKKSKVSFPPFRMTGLELTLDMSFQNQEVHGRVDHAGTVLSIEVVARPDWESMPVVYNLQPLEPVSGNGMTVKRHFYGVRVRFVSGGRFDSKSYPVMFGAISSFILYLQLPGMLVAAIAVFLLGVPSAFYYEAANERMELKRIANSYIARALGYCSSFRAAADRGKSPGARVASGGFSRQCLNEEVRNLAESEQLDATGTPKMVDLLLEEHDTDKNGYLSVEDLTLASLAHEMTTLKGIGDLMNEDRQKFVFERLFVPEVKVEDRRAIALRAKRAALAAQREQLRARNSQAEAFAQQRPSQTRASRLSAARRRPAGEGSASEAASSDLPASSDLAQAEAQGEAAEEAAAAAPVARIPAAQADPLGAGDPPQGAPTPAGL